MSADLDPARIEPLLAGAFGRPYRFEAACASTQDLAREPGLPEGAVIAADHQSAGRGRSGRAWEDRPGDALLLSLVLDPAPGPALPQLSLVVALAVAQAIEETTGLGAGVKWPNDIELDGRKVGGILLEAAGGRVICGVGVNVNQDETRLPTATRRPAGSLRVATGSDHDRGHLLCRILAHLEPAYASWQRDGLGPLLPGLEARNVLHGRRVTVARRHGVAGRLADDGRIAVTFDGGRTELVASGEVEPQS